VCGFAAHPLFFSQKNLSQMKVISGTISLSQWSSDGDTFAFKANNLADWNGLPIKPRPTEPNPWVRVRLDACDTPELHYSYATQSTLWGRASTQFFADLFGMGAIDWSISGNRPLNTIEAGARLSIVGIDKFKRVIGLLHPPSGALSAANSANLQLIEAGLAYPAIYETTPEDYATGARDAWASARAVEAGFSGLDKTFEFDMVNVATDQDAVMIQPKVWRRVIHYAQNYASTESWEAYLKGRNDLFLPPTGKIQNLRKVMVRAGDVITIAPDSINATWDVSGGLTSSQILAFLSTIAI